MRLADDSHRSGDRVGSNPPRDRIDARFGMVPLRVVTGSRERAAAERAK